MADGCVRVAVGGTGVTVAVALLVFVAVALGVFVGRGVRVIVGVLVTVAVAVVVTVSSEKTAGSAWRVVDIVAVSVTITDVGVVVAVGEGKAAGTTARLAQTRLPAQPIPLNSNKPKSPQAQIGSSHFFFCLTDDNVGGEITVFDEVGGGGCMVVAPSAARISSML